MLECCMLSGPSWRNSNGWDLEASTVKAETRNNTSGASGQDIKAV